MDVSQRLMEAGFSRVIVLSGQECGVEAETIILALWRYEAEEEPACGEAWIHPYYFASQKAYTAASSLVREARAAGISLTLRDEIRVKPIFARLPGFSQGRNTLSYAEGMGSRFHVQIMTLDQPLTPTHHLEPAPHGLHCGNCRLCLEKCPTKALDDDGFHRERCLRNWMMPGQSVPEPVREAMGGRLIGCDVCQQCCPYNVPPKEGCHAPVPMKFILIDPKAASAALKDQIGANLVIPNRMLSQACIMAGSTGRTDLLPELQRLANHPSANVREHAAWAVRQITKSADDQ